jgi:hypothetical protein
VKVNQILPEGKPLKNQETIRIFKKLEVVSRSSLRNEREGYKENHAPIVKVNTLRN